MFSLFNQLRTFTRHNKGRQASGHLNIKSKMFDFVARVLIGWLANTLIEPANQNVCLKVKHFC